MATRAVTLGAVTVLVVLAACAVTMPNSGAVIIEAQSPAIGSDGTLAEYVGLEILGGSFLPLLDVGCSVPCENSEIFSFSVDNQDQITISLYRGIVSRVEDATPLGRFQIVGIPPMERGLAQIKVTLSARGADLMLEANELTTARQCKIVSILAGAFGCTESDPLIGKWEWEREMNEESEAIPVLTIERSSDGTLLASIEYGESKDHSWQTVRTAIVIGDEVTELTQKLRLRFLPDGGSLTYNLKMVDNDTLEGELQIAYKRAASPLKEPVRFKRIR